MNGAFTDRVDYVKKQITMVIPAYNEAANVVHIVEAIDKIVKGLDYDFEFMFIDDGSTDDTYARLVDLAERRNDINVIKFSRNFGKEAALCAGLNYCKSDAAIILDADLQHPPHIIQGMIYEWEQGAHVVDAVKIVRQKENIVKRVLSLSFYRLMHMLTGINLTGASDYKLLDRKAIEILNTLEEKNRFFRGLTSWVGFRHSRIEFRVEERKEGVTKWNLMRLIKLSLDAITSYTSKPLHVVTLFGLFTLAFSVLLGLQTLYNKLYGHAVSGFTTVILILLLMSSIIMISIGVLGLYLSRIFNEVKNRPIYIVEDLKAPADKKAGGTG